MRGPGKEGYEFGMRLLLFGDETRADNLEAVSAGKPQGDRELVDLCRRRLISFHLLALHSMNRGRAN